MSGYIHERKVPTATQQEARKAFRQADTKVALSEYERSQRAFHANRERLRAERLAREAMAQAPPRSEKMLRKTSVGDGSKGRQ